MTDPVMHPQLHVEVRSAPVAESFNLVRRSRMASDAPHRGVLSLHAHAQVCHADGTTPGMGLYVRARMGTGSGQCTSEADGPCPHWSEVGGVAWGAVPGPEPTTCHGPAVHGADGWGGACPKGGGVGESSGGGTWCGTVRATALIMGRPCTLRRSLSSRPKTWLPLAGACAWSCGGLACGPTGS